MSHVTNETIAKVLRVQASCKRLGHAGDKLGAWLSAALDDPNVCDEMKADIRAWFEAFDPFSFIGNNRQ